MEKYIDVLHEALKRVKVHHMKRHSRERKECFPSRNLYKWIRVNEKEILNESLVYHNIKSIQEKANCFLIFKIIYQWIID
jgi:hypothetical protein